MSSLTGDIRRHPDFESRVLGNRRAISVYLPPNYENEPDRRYPVMYFHDGQNVFDGKTSFIPNQEWRVDETVDALIRAKQIPAMIVVAVDNAQAGRADEYLPTRRQTNFAREPIGGKADDYGKMLMHELMPFINQTYRTKTGAANTGLAGSSLGGIVTLHLGLTHPNVFGKLGVVSPSVWWDDRLMVKRVRALQAKPKLRIWLDMGTKEGYQALLDARSLKYALEDEGWTVGKDLAYFEDSGAQHNEAAWAGRVERMMRFLFAD